VPGAFAYAFPMNGLLVGLITAVVLAICAFLSLIAVKPKAIKVVDNLHGSQPSD